MQMQAGNAWQHEKRTRRDAQSDETQSDETVIAVLPAKAPIKLADCAYNNAKYCFISFTV
jgi:hypothetical protein